MAKAVRDRVMYRIWVPLKRSCAMYKEILMFRARSRNQSAVLDECHFLDWDENIKTPF